MYSDPRTVSQIAAIVETAALFGAVLSVRTEALRIMEKNRTTHLSLADIEASVVRLATERKGSHSLQLDRRDPFPMRSPLAGQRGARAAISTATSSMFPQAISNTSGHRRRKTRLRTQKAATPRGSGGPNTLPKGATRSGHQDLTIS